MSHTLLSLLSREVLNHCYQALQIRPDSAKALFRRAVALRCLDQYDEARAAIVRAIELQPGDVRLREEYVTLKSTEARGCSIQCPPSLLSPSPLSRALSRALSRSAKSRD